MFKRKPILDTCYYFEHQVDMICREFEFIVKNITNNSKDTLLTIKVYSIHDPNKISNICIQYGNYVHCRRYYDTYPILEKIKRELNIIYRMDSELNVVYDINKYLSTKFCYSDHYYFRLDGNIAIIEMYINDTFEKGFVELHSKNPTLMINTIKAKIDLIINSATKTKNIIDSFAIKYMYSEIKNFIPDDYELEITALSDDKYEFNIIPPANIDPFYIYICHNFITKPKENFIKEFKTAFINKINSVTESTIRIPVYDLIRHDYKVNNKEFHLVNYFEELKG